MEADLLDQCSVVDGDAGSSQPEEHDQYDTSNKISTSTVASSPPALNHSKAGPENGQTAFPVDTDRPAVCLQCEIKHLPCNMDQPSCTRCLRTGEEMCLAQRQTSLQDILEAKGPLSKAVLKKFDSDDPGKWEYKMNLREQLLEHERDKHKWALPRIESPRGGSFICRRTSINGTCRQLFVEERKYLSIHWSPVSQEQASANRSERDHE